MTSSTRSPGDPRAASVIFNRMFSLPDTCLSSATKSLVTLVSACVDPVHGRDEQVDQGVGDLPLSAVQVGGQQRLHDLVRVGARVAGPLGRDPGPPARQHLRATPANRSLGRPTARVAPSLNCSMVFTMTLPGSSRIAANASTPVTSAASNGLPSPPGPTSSPRQGQLPARSARGSGRRPQRVPGWRFAWSAPARPAGGPRP